MLLAYTRHDTIITCLSIVERRFPIISLFFLPVSVELSIMSLYVEGVCVAYSLFFILLLLFLFYCLCLVSVIF